MKADGELSWLWQRLQAAGEKPFLLQGEQAISYAALSDRLGSLAACLNDALALPACLGLCSDFSLDGVAGLLAAVQTKQVVAPIVTQQPEAIRRRVEEGGLTHLWHLRGDDELEGQTPVPVPSPLVTDLQNRGRPGLILFSSGSTGKPKAMLHDFASLLAVYQNRRPKNLRLLAFLLFDHIGGLHTLLGALASQATLVVPESRDAESVARAIEQHKVAVLPASPSFLSLLLMSGAPDQYDLTSLRIVSYGTEPMPETLLHRLRTALPRVRFIQTFGTSETGISQTVSRSSDSLALRIDDPHTAYRIVEGELWLKSDTRISGYLNAESDRFTPDGWFRTGDLVEELGDGFLRIHGRASDLINVGGEKVFPTEIESAILELSEVDDCLALAAPNPITGQSVMVQVVAHPGAAVDALKSTIRRHCRARLEAYKCPTRIRFVEKTALGERLKRNRWQAG